MQTILMKATGRSSKTPIVILTGPKIGAKTSTTLGGSLSRALSKAWKWAVCNCTPRNILRAIFCGKASMVVATVLAAAMWWHNISIDDPIAAGEAVATDCLYALPWGIVWVVRATISSFKEGGEL